MKNFVILTDVCDRKHAINVLQISSFDEYPDSDPDICNSTVKIEGGYEYVVKETIEEIVRKMEEAQNESHEFVTFVHTSLGETVCVKVSEICWMRECSSAKWTKVCVNVLGEFDVYENIHIISEKLNSTKFYGEY